MSDALKPTGDRKTKFHKNQQNTFGLLPGNNGTCPGCTMEKGGCWYLAPGRRTRTCYVDNLMNVYSGVKGVLQHNTGILKSATQAEMTEILHAEFTRFEAVEDRMAKSSGKDQDLFYRLHWSGDVFSHVYAEALVEAMTKHPRITFWGYTRSFDAVPILLKAKNLILHLSLDQVNLVRGLQCYEDNDGPTLDRLQVCYMAETNNFPYLRNYLLEIFRTRNALRVAVGLKAKPLEWLATMELHECPVDTGKLKTEFGCMNCKACVTRGKRAVWFKS